MIVSQHGHGCQMTNILSIWGKTFFVRRVTLFWGDIFAHMHGEAFKEAVFKVPLQKGKGGEGLKVQGI